MQWSTKPPKQTYPRGGDVRNRLIWIWLPRSEYTDEDRYRETRCLTFTTLREEYHSGKSTELYNFFGNKVPSHSSGYWSRKWAADGVDADTGHTAAILMLFAGIAALAGFALTIYAAWGTFT